MVRWNLELTRFGNRVGVYLFTMDDEYPSTDEMQAVHLGYRTPDAERRERGLPLVKWLLAFPHYIVLACLYIGVFFAPIAAWFAILFTGRYPRHLQLRRGHDPVGQPRNRLRLHPRHLRVPALPAEALRASR